MPSDLRAFSISEIAKEFALNSIIDYSRRAIPHVPPPSGQAPTNRVFVNGRVDHAYLRGHFYNEGKLKEEEVLRILETSNLLFMAEPNLLELDAPANVCGDVHGQYYDLLKLFEVGGPIESRKYLFLGDYVDRGCFSIECYLYLLSLKMNFPDKIYMLRGNHECRHLTEYFTFKNEATHKYSDRIYEACLKSFQKLPLAAILNKQFFCVHGGISPELKSIQDIHKINRFVETPPVGLMCDLLWSDPLDNFESAESLTESFTPNTVRGCSYFFTYRAAFDFLEQNSLLSIIRAHEAQDAGYRMYKQTPSTGFPTVITVFSAPNYLDYYNNKAAILQYDNNLLNIKQFNDTSHPYWLPNFMDAFSWSLPFVMEKITELLLAVLNIYPLEEMFVDCASFYERRDVICFKIMAVAKVRRVFTILRKESETIKKLKRSTKHKHPPIWVLVTGWRGNERCNHLA